MCLQDMCSVEWGSTFSAIHSTHRANLVNYHSFYLPKLLHQAYGNIILIFDLRSYHLTPTHYMRTWVRE